MKTSEWVAIIFGLAGFLLSCLALYGTTRADRQTRGKDLSEKRLDALLAIDQAEKEVRSARRAFRELRAEGEAQQNPECVEMADRMIAANDESLSRIEAAKVAVRRRPPVAEYDAYYEVLDEAIVAMRGIASDFAAQENRARLMETVPEVMRLEREAKSRGLT